MLKRKCHKLCYLVFLSSSHSTCPEVKGRDKKERCVEGRGGEVRKEGKAREKSMKCETCK